MNTKTAQNHRTHLLSLISERLSDANLKVDDLALEMAMCHTKFYNIVNDLFGVTPAVLLHQCRLQRARLLLLEGKYSVREVALLCGFNDVKYFSSCFRKFHGVLPSRVE